MTLTEPDGLFERAGREAQPATGADVHELAIRLMQVGRISAAQAIAAARAIAATGPLSPAADQDVRVPEVVLVWRDERGDEICRSTPLEPGQTRIAIPLDAQHADLITADQDGGTT